MGKVRIVEIVADRRIVIVEHRISLTPSRSIYAAYFPVEVPRDLVSIGSCPGPNPMCVGSGQWIGFVKSPKSSRVAVRFAAAEAGRTSFPVASITFGGPDPAPPPPVQPAPPVQIPPPPAPPPPAGLPEILRRAQDVLTRRGALGNLLPGEATARLQCLVRMLAEPYVDDRFITYDSLVAGAIQPLTTEQLRSLMRRVKDYMRRYLSADRSDLQVLQDLERLDHLIWTNGIAIINMHVQTRGGLADPAKRQILDWMATQQRRRNSVYSCYGGVRY